MYPKPRQMKRSDLFLLFRLSKSTITKKVATNAILTISRIFINTQTIKHVRVNIRLTKISFHGNKKKTQVNVRIHIFTTVHFLSKVI